MKKIDILNKKTIILDDFENQRLFIEKNNLENNEVLIVDEFLLLVENKTLDPYTHIFVELDDLKRFVNIKKDSEEVFYEELTTEEKAVWNAFVTLIQSKNI